MLALFVANFALTFIPTEHYRKAVDESIRSGTFFVQDYLLFRPDKPNHRYGYSECAMLGSMLMPRESRLKATVSPLWTIANSGQPQPADQSIRALLPKDCGTALVPILGAIQSGHLDGGRVPTEHYHRYIHGTVTLWALTLAVLPISAASVALLVLCYSILIAILISAAIRIRGVDQTERERLAAFVIIAVVLMTFFGAASSDRTFFVGPPDAVIFVFILTALWQPLGQISEARFVTLAAALGSATAILEYLSGGIPMNLAVLIALIALNNPPDRRVLLRRLAIGIAAFGVAGVTCFVVKILAVRLVWGTGELGVFFYKLAVQMSGPVMLPAERLAKLADYGIDPAWIDLNHVTHILFAGVMLTYSSFAIGWGSHILGALIVLVPVPVLLGFAYFAVRRRRVSEWPIERLALVAVGLVPVGWYVVMPILTIAHSSYLVRPMAMPLALMLIVSPVRGWIAARAAALSGRTITTQTRS